MHPFLPPCFAQKRVKGKRAGGLQPDFPIRKRLNIPNPVGVCTTTVSAFCHTRTARPLSLSSSNRGKRVAMNHPAEIARKKKYPKMHAHERIVSNGCMSRKKKNASHVSIPEGVITRLVGRFLTAPLNDEEKATFYITRGRWEGVVERPFSLCLSLSLCSPGR